jgi:3-hydroxyisobutyrate dehydrogenase
MSELPKPTIAFVGLGVMGRPMALNLLRAGYSVRAFDINPAAMDIATSAGAHAALSPHDAAAGADVLICMVVNDAQMRTVLFEPGNAARALKPGSIVIGMSTMSRAAVQTIASELAEIDIAYIDAPVSGGEVGAQAASLSIMVGADDEALARALPVLSVMGKHVYHIGKSVGDGQAMKMVNQLLVCVHNAVAAEALVFGQQLGLDPRMIFDIISNSAGNSWIFQNRGARMLSREFTPPKSALSILVKDLGIVVDAANQAGFPLPLGSASHQLYKMAAAQGWTSLDDSILVRLLEQLSGESH